MGKGCLCESTLRHDLYHELEASQQVRFDERDDELVPSERSTIEPSDRASDVGSEVEKLATQHHMRVSEPDHRTAEVRKCVSRSATPCKSAMDWDEGSIVRAPAAVEP